MAPCSRVRVYFFGNGGTMKMVGVPVVVAPLLVIPVIGLPFVIDLDG